MTSSAPSSLRPAALSPARAAEYLGVSRATLYGLLRRDAALRRCRVYLGTAPMFVVSRLDRWLASRPDAPQVAS